MDDQKFIDDFAAGLVEKGEDYGLKLDENRAKELTKILLGKSEKNVEKPLVPDRCPNCGCSGVSYGSLTVESGWVSQDADCPECGYSWSDIYKLVEQEPIVDIGVEYGRRAR